MFEPFRPHHQRRKSVDSSSSSSSSDSDSDSSTKKRLRKEKKERKRREKEAEKRRHELLHKMDGSHTQHGGQMPLMPAMPLIPGEAPGMPTPEHHSPGQSPAGAPPPPAYEGQGGPPPSGYRIPLNTDSNFPTDQFTLGQVPCRDLDGSPIYFGSALFERSVHPCKIGPHLNPHAHVPYGGKETGHHGRYDLLPFDPNTMELVQTSRGEIPSGRRPIEGGYEEDGAKLYHAVALVNNLRIPGKTGTHLKACNVSFGGKEHAVQHYEILCWKN